MDDETTIDFTSGSPIRKLFLFSLPLVAIMILESLYNTADSIIVGRYVGEDALSAVSSVGAVSSLAMMLVYGACTGISVIISQYAGARDGLMVKRSAVTGTYFVAVLSLLLGAAGTLLAPRLLTLINVPENIRNDALLYLRVILLGTPVFSFYSMADAVSRAMGDSVTPMIVLLISAVVNVALNLLFVVKFHLAVAGVAYATVMAEGLSALVCAFIIWHKLPMIRPNRASLRPDGTVLRNILRIGVPSVLESSTSSVGNLLVTSLLNTFGSTVIGAYSSALKIEMLVSYAPGGFTGGMQVWTGQNLGAGKPERVKKGYNATVIAIAVYSLFSAAVFLAFGRPLVSVFIKEGEEFISIGARYLLCASTGLFSVGMLYLSRSTLVGAGDAKAALLSSVVELVFRLGAAYLLSRRWGYTGVFLSAPVGYTAGALFATARYLSGRWKEKPVTA